MREEGMTVAWLESSTLGFAEGGGEKWREGVGGGGDEGVRYDGVIRGWPGCREGRERISGLDVCRE